MRNEKNQMLAGIKVWCGQAVFIFLLSACASNNSSEEEIKYAGPNDITQNFQMPTELSSAQQAAFDALNKLQVSTDEMNRLYSTFAGIVHSCYPLDTSLTISQQELQNAMKQFISSNCKALSDVECDELAATLVLAQQEYSLSICLGNSVNESFENGIPRSGTWLLPNVLGRRDVVIVW